MQDMNKKKLITRLSRIEGQVRGLKKMIEENSYCVDIITQTSAVRSALSSLENEMLEAHLKCCVIDQVQHGKKDRAIEEIMKIYKLKRK